MAASSQRVALNADAVGRAVDRIAAFVTCLSGDLSLVGIRRGGVHLAERLKAGLEVTGRKIPLGILDIALYRDDAFRAAHRPVVGPTQIDFSIEGQGVVLVDDVLYTGRTIRAALDELMDFGRPRRVYLAVLVDRGGRELPIAPDAVGAEVKAAPDENVEVHLCEDGGVDQVVIQPAPERRPR